MANSQKDIKNDLIKVYNRLNSLDVEGWQKESDEIKKEIERIINELSVLEKQALCELTEENNRKVLKDAVIRGEVETPFEVSKPKRKRVYKSNPVLKFITSPLMISMMLAVVIVLLIILLVI